MNVNNVELNSISNKLEFKETQKSIDNSVQKLFGQDAFEVNSGSSKNQLFKIGENNQEDIMEALSAEPSEFVKGALVALGKTATSQDLTQLSEEGYQLEDDKVDTIVTITDKIQIYLATHCEDYQVTGDISMEAVKEVAGNSQAVYEIAKQLDQNNLPITDENITQTKEAMELAKQLPPITDGGAKYIINNGLAPTIENLYKAEFSGLGIEGGTYAAGYFSEGSGYYAKTTDEFNWDGLKEQISKVIEGANLEVNDKTVSDAKWLIENHIPLTKESLSQYETLKDMTLPISEEEVLGKIIQALQEGKNPSQALLSSHASFSQRAQESYQVIQTATDENLQSVIDKNLPVTISNLKKEQEIQDESGKTDTTVEELTNTKENTTNQVQATKDNISFITAKRQLEEIRLQMTVEANYRLLKQGISLETTDLQTVIEGLKKAEESYYKQLLSDGDVEQTTQNVSALKEISTKISDIKYLPSDVLGRVITGETPNTINGIHESATTLKNNYEAANQSYEALMTKPRSDMGDNIAKAFQNVDDILTDLGLEITESNQRAVRILGYNSMDITTENINAIKAADASVNQTISSLTPQVVLTMIREGINPLDTNINDLNNQIKEISQQVQDDNSQEKYSEFLYRLEKNSEITGQEREAFIGMYRLLHHVEKTDGEVVGALVNQNADITLNNLLTGVRNIKNRGIDVKVDNQFGELDSLNFESNSISKQLETSFGSGSDSSASGQSSDSATYYNNLVDKALREISPDKLASVFEEGNLQDMSLEKFVDKLTYAKENEMITKEYYKEQLSTIQKVAQVESNVIQMLSDFRQPTTISNILATEAMMNKRGGMFQTLASQEEEESDVMQAMDDIPESMTSKESMTKAYENLEKEVDDLVEQQVQKADVTSVDLKELKLLRNQIRLTTSLSKEERYEVPVKIGEEITSIRLTVIRGTDLGKVSVTMENETVGKAAAQFMLKENNASGYVVADTQAGLELLKATQSDMNQQLTDSGIELNQVDYILGQDLDINRWQETNESNQEAGTSSTKDLYCLAKAFVVSMQNLNHSKI